MNYLFKSDILACYNIILANRLLTNKNWEDIGETFETFHATTVIPLSDEYKNSRTYDLSLCAQNTTVESIHDNEMFEESSIAIDKSAIGFAIVNDTMFFVIQYP